MVQLAVDADLVPARGRGARTESETRMKTARPPTTGVTKTAGANETGTGTAQNQIAGDTAVAVTKDDEKGIRSVVTPSVENGLTVTIGTEKRIGTHVDASETSPLKSTDRLIASVVGTLKRM